MDQKLGSLVVLQEDLLDSTQLSVTRQDLMPSPGLYEHQVVHRHSHEINI